MLILNYTLDCPQGIHLPAYSSHSFEIGTFIFSNTAFSLYYFEKILPYFSFWNSKHQNFLHDIFTALFNANKIFQLFF